MSFVKPTRLTTPQPADTSTPHWYLIAYDITDSRRLMKIHKLIKRHGGLPLQKSLFAWLGNARRRDKLIKALSKRINTDEDDIRLYPITNIQAIDLWGATHLDLATAQKPRQTAWSRLKGWITHLKNKKPSQEQAP